MSVHLATVIVDEGQFPVWLVLAVIAVVVVGGCAAARRAHPDRSETISPAGNRNGRAHRDIE